MSCDLTKFINPTYPNSFGAFGKIKNVTDYLGVSREEIVAHAIDASAVPLKGVYFLLDGDDIVYVGQTVNLYRRLETHLNFKQFTRIAFISVQHGDGSTNIKSIEKFYIRKLKPKYNKVLKKDKSYTSYFPGFGLNTSLTRPVRAKKQ